MRRVYSTLTHLVNGKAKMVDISSKAATLRTAIATGTVTLGKMAFDLIKQDKLAKGNAITVAQISGIQAAKQTSALIPLCHNLPLSNVSVSFSFNDADHSVLVHCSSSCVGTTGVEIEAIVGTSIACAAIYDMCKSVNKAIVISDIKLLSKTGGLSGDYLSIPSKSAKPASVNHSTLVQNCSHEANKTKTPPALDAAKEMLKTSSTLKAPAKVLLKTTASLKTSDKEPLKTTTSLNKPGYTIADSEHLNNQILNHLTSGSHLPFRDFGLSVAHKKHLGEESYRFPGIMYQASIPSVYWACQTLLSAISEPGSPSFSQKDIANCYLDLIEDKINQLDRISPHNDSRDLKVNVKQELIAFAVNQISAYHEARPFAITFAQRFGLDSVIPDSRKSLSSKLLEEKGIHQKPQTDNPNKVFYNENVDVKVIADYEYFDMFLNSARLSKYVGFDCEWYGDGVDLIQLCFSNNSDVVFVLDMVHLKPQEASLYLKHLLNLKLIGFEVSQDLARIAKHIGFVPSNEQVVDLKRLSPNNGISLSRMVNEVLGCELDKRPRLGNWSKRPISSTMLRYAAYDAQCILKMLESPKLPLNIQAKIKEF
jgi:molybdenum cofactor biosynthesis protein MoaC